MKHKYYDLIVAWAKGEEIQVYYDGYWIEADMPQLMFGLNNAIKTYRIKPKEPEWWENIPEHGVLVKDKEDHKNIMLWRQNFCRTDDYIPLTNEEIERFKR